MSSESGSLSLPVHRLPSASVAVPEPVSAPIEHGASRVAVAANFLRLYIFPLLVEADLYRCFGLESVAEISYVKDEDAAGTGTGRLTPELPSVTAAGSFLGSRR